MYPGIHFHLNHLAGVAPCIAIMDVAEAPGLLGTPSEFFIGPGETFLNIGFDELAQAERGMLILVADGQAKIVSNDNWPHDPEEPR